MCFFFCFILLPSNEKKSIDFGNDICRYTDPTHDNLYTYVKGCPKGKYCASADITNNGVSKYVPSTEVIKRLGDEYKIDLDCDGSRLYYINNVCSIKDGQPYLYGSKKYCPSGKIYNSTTDIPSQNQHMLQCINKEQTQINVTLNFMIIGEIIYIKIHTNLIISKFVWKKNYRLVGSSFTNNYYKHISTEMNYIGRSKMEM